MSIRFHIICSVGIVPLVAALSLIPVDGRGQAAVAPPAKDPGVAVQAAAREAGSSNAVPAPAKTGGGVSVDAYSKLIQENLDLRNKLDQAAQDCNVLKRQNASLSLLAESLEQKRQNLIASLKEAKPADESQAEIAKLREDKGRLETELAAAKKRAEERAAAVAEAKPAAPSGTPVEGSDLYRKLEKENAELRGQMARLQEAEQELARAKVQMEGKGVQLEGDVGRMSGEKAELAASVSELGRAREQDRKDMVTLARVAKRYQTEAERLKVNLSRAEERLQKAESDLKALSGVVRNEGLGSLPSSMQGKFGMAAADAQQKRDALYNKGIALAKEGRYARAEKAYLLALQLDPQDAAVHYNLGVLYETHLKSPRNALDQYRAYVRLNPHAADADIVRGWIVELEMGSPRR